MELPAWDKALRVDGGPLDLQHQHLLALTTLIAEKAKAGDASEAKRLFQLLYQDCLQHFSDEEAFMATIAYPHRDEHQREHQRLLTHVQLRLYDSASDPAGVNLVAIMDCLRSLVIMHILNDDMEIGGFIKRVDDRHTASP